VDTTYDQAEAAIAGQPPAQPGGDPVYLVEMKGKFVDNFDSRDPFDDRGPYRGRYFTLVIDRTTCLEGSHGIGRTRVRLRPLGQVATIR
jgi:hypothetical protein